MATRRGVLAAVAGVGTAWQALPVNAGRKKKKKQDKKVKPTFPRNANVSGTGPQVSASFQLAKGVYRANATVVTTSSSGGLFFADLYNSRGLVDYVFIENPEWAGTFQFEDLAEVPADGTYYFYIEEAEGSWSISLHQL